MLGAAAALVLAALAAAGAPVLGVASAVVVVCGAIVGDVRLAALEAPVETIGAGRHVDAGAVMLEAPRPSPYGSSAAVELLDGGLAGVHVLARAPDDVALPDGGPGTVVALAGFARPPRANPEADFDWPAHLRRSGLAAELEVASVEATGTRRGGLAGALDSLRERAEVALGQGVAEQHAALIRGMVLGQDERIDELLRADFQTVGLAHILAVSGQNVLLLCVLALPLLGALGCGPRSRALVLVVLIAVYVPLAGAGPSLQRAGVMGAAGLAAVALSRRASRCYALLLAAAATLALNPLVIGGPAWQLSFAAVAGILLLAGRLRRALSRVPRPLAEGVAVSVAATLATAPLIAHHFDQVSLVSLPVNLLALPAVAPAMWIGMAQIAVGQLTALGEPVATLALALCGALGTLNAAILSYIEGLVGHFAELPGAATELELGSPLELAVAYVAIIAATLASIRLARRVGPAATALLGLWTTIALRTRLPLAVLLAAAVLGTAAEVTDVPNPPERLTVTFLDVGQGDATLVQHPAGGTVLIDGGPAEARTYRLVREQGVERLDLVVATHAAADHHGGLLEVVERIPVELLLEGGDGTDDPSFAALLAAAERRGVQTMPARAGQRLQVGALAVEVLSPPPRPPGPAPEDPNARAVTTLVRAGELELFASGDAESPSLAGLDLPDVDVLKVPHHGSDDEGLPEVLDMLAPEVAAIGVGEENGYGHPTPATLAALERADARVYRTDLDGTITLTVVAGALHVDTER